MYHALKWDLLNIGKGPNNMPQIKLIRTTVSVYDCDLDDPTIRGFYDGVTDPVEAAKKDIEHDDREALFEKLESDDIRYQILDKYNNVIASQEPLLDELLEAYPYYKQLRELGWNIGLSSSDKNLWVAYIHNSSVSYPPNPEYKPLSDALQDILAFLQSTARGGFEDL